MAIKTQLDDSMGNVGLAFGLTIEGENYKARMINTTTTRCYAEWKATSHGSNRKLLSAWELFFVAKPQWAIMPYLPYFPQKLGSQVGIVTRNGASLHQLSAAHNVSHTTDE